VLNGKYLDVSKDPSAVILKAEQPRRLGLREPHI